MKTNLMHSLVAAVMVIGLAACSGNSSVESDLSIKGAPDWVNEGTQAISNDDGRLIYGVGMSAVVGDTSLQKNVSDNRARAEVASILSTTVDSSSGDYTTASGGVANNSVEQQIKTQTQLALKGAKVIGRWRNEESGDIYSIVELDLDNLEDAIERAKGLTDEVKQQAIAKTNMNFDRFVKENP